MSSPETDSGQRFGRYELLRPISKGGMGEIYLARTRGAHDFEKKVVIKRILSHLAEDPEFRDKFIDEANIVTHLTHGNIVQVLAMDKEGDELFIAMEYVPGRDLREVLRRCKREGALLPVAVALFIVGEACKGLDYAHRKLDAQGRPLGIVHRDISPSNVLISSEGAVKILDFGIAKARGRISKSITGRLQGKFSYMSPEQAAGKPVDARSDIFSTGTLLYEMLTGTRPFDGEFELESLDKVKTHHPPPPSTLREGLDPEIDALVMKALSKDPDARFDQIGVMEKAIFTHLSTSGYTRDSHVAEAVASLFPEGFERPEAQTAPGLTIEEAFDAEIDRLLDGQTPTPTVDPHIETATSSAPESAPNRPEGTVSIMVDGPELARVEPRAVKVRIETSPNQDAEAIGRSPTADMPALTPTHNRLPPELARTDSPVSDPNVPIPYPPPPPMRDRPPIKKRWRIIGGLAVAALFILLGSILWLNVLAPPTLKVITTPPNAQIKINGELAGIAGKRIKNLPTGWVKVTAHLEGYEVETNRIELGRGENEWWQVELSPLDKAVETTPPIAVRFESNPPGADVTLAGKVLGKTNGVVMVPAVGVVVVTVSQSGASLPHNVTIDPDNLKTVYKIDFEMNAAKVDADAGVVAEADAGPAEAPDASEATEPVNGKILVNVNSTPGGADILIGGQPSGFKTPRRIQLPVGRSVNIGVRLAGYESVSRVIAVGKGNNSVSFGKLTPIKEKPPVEPVKEGTPQKVTIRCLSKLSVRGPTCKVKVAGKSLSRNNAYTVTLPPGSHRAVATSYLGAVTRSRSFTVSDKSLRIDIYLDRSVP